MNDSSSASTMPPTRWYDGLAQYQQQGIAHVLATVVAVNGSAPRALQAKMVITVDSCCDTLGGGGLEHDVMTTARQLLNGEIEATASKSSKKEKISKKNLNSEMESKSAKAVRRDTVYTKHYPLGAKLAQCCGGSVTVMFECFNVTPPLSILVFGAGHVAAALMTVLAELPCQVDWVDSRAEMFEPYLLDTSNQTDQPTLNLKKPVLYQLPAHIRPHVSDEPVDFILPFITNNSQNSSPCSGTQRFILIMTHDHGVDFELVRASVDVILDNNILASNLDNDLDNDNAITDSDNPRVSIPYIGCIGSVTKAKRFKDRLLHRGYSEHIVDKLTMPIGLPIGGKEPMAVAVSIASQILQNYHQS
ncbi:XdhC family protein [Psychrobacter sp. LV10R520-6]|uniref:XdhC family protein n=1 Tax=Psychrobacter sp. LV10R520-6 TaxID=1415574 RepID=UPI002AA0D0CA|nr:XdhC family protein [Psychrobacter sp. LV10R520-6]